MEDDLKFLAQRVADQERLLVAYRIGGRPPIGAVDRLVKGRDRWDALRQELKK